MSYSYDTKGGSGSFGSKGGSDSFGKKGGSGSFGSKGGSDSFGKTESFGSKGGSDSFGSKGGSGSFGSKGGSDSFGSKGGSGSFGSKGGSGSFGKKGGSDSFGSKGGSDSFGSKGGSDSFGSKGSSGSKGDSGSFGKKGGSGSFGSKGGSDSFGSKGSSGSKGDSGSFGKKGGSGSFGSKGGSDSFGSKGGSDSFGSKGSSGSNGSKGSSGSNGSKGSSSSGGSNSNSGSGGSGGSGGGKFNESPVYDNVPLNGRISVMENMKQVIDIDASDDYDSEGNGLKYFIVGGKDRDFYEIDRKTGKLSFLDAPDFEKPLDHDGDNTYDVIVRVVDSHGAFTDQPLWVKVTDKPDTPTNRDPIAKDDHVMAKAGGQVGIRVLDNDFDPDGDDVKIKFSATDKISDNGGTIKWNRNGTPDDFSDDKLVYKPAAGFTGVDTFQYAISDGNGGMDMATVKITVKAGDPGDGTKNLIRGTNGDDLLEGASGQSSDDIRGLGGNDTLRGFAGHDCLVGGAGNDKLHGNDGNDTLDGTDSVNDGVGEWDVLAGGKGKDVFVLGDKDGAYYLGKGNKDFALIKDFELGQDKLVLNGSVGDYEFKGNEIYKDGDLVANLVGVRNFELTGDDIQFTS